jgi:nicotinamidase-related amidase
LTVHLPRPESSTLLVIDIQERLTPAMPVSVLPGVLRNTRILMETAREFNLPVIASEQYPKGLGPTVSEIAEMLPADSKPYEKLSFSCCAATSMQLVFEQPGQRDWILCGMETHVCVLQTALDLLQLGQNVFVAADGVCSRTKANWRTGLDLMRQAGAVIGSTEIFAFGLLGAAGSEKFKKISRLVK